MVENSRRALPPELAEKLSSLRLRLSNGMPDRELREVLSAVSNLPPSQVVRASGDIAYAVTLDWGQPRRRFWLSPFLHQPVREKDLLKKYPNYAWLFLFHHSGYVREAALKAIHTPPASPFFFAALAWRLNDWVEPVRLAAKHCAERVFPLANTKVTAVAALYLLDRRFIWGRWNDEADILDAAFSSKEVVRALVAELGTRPTGRLTTSLRYALRYPDMDEHLQTLAATARQPAVRAVAYQCLLAGSASWPKGYEWIWIDKVYGLKKRVLTFETRAIAVTQPVEDLIRQGVRDKSPKVRSMAAEALIKARSQMPDADIIVRKLAEDRSLAVRSRADYLLRHPVTHTT